LGSHFSILKNLDSWPLMHFQNFIERNPTKRKQL